MIVLNSNQKISLCNILNTHKESLIASGVWVEPLEIKNNLWILPEAVLNDERLSEIKALVEGKLSEVIFREITEDEIITINNNNII